MNQNTKSASGNTETDTTASQPNNDAAVATIKEEPVEQVDLNKVKKEQPPKKTCDFPSDIEIIEM